MNALQLSKRSMYFVVEDYLATVPEATLATMPDFEAFYQKFTEKVVSIGNFSASQTTSRLGYSRVKEELKATMVAQAIDVASRIKGFAMNSHNVVLEAEMDQRISYLGKRPASVCADICSFLHSKGVLLLADLVNYGVTVEMLSSLETAIATFRDSIPKPKDAIDNRVDSTRKIAVLFKECDALLKNMDTLAEMLRFSNSLFFDNYFQRRKLEKPSYRTIDFMGDVTDSDGNAISKVTVIIGDTGIVKETTSKGHFEVKNLPSGIYSVSFAKAGYIETTVQVAVTQTQRTEIVVVLDTQTGIVDNVA